MAFDVHKIKSAHVMSDYIGRHVKLRRQGSEHVGLSPFQKERTPSFTVNDKKNLWWDFSSGTGGDLIQFVQQYHRVGFTEACEILGGERVAPGNLPAPIERQPADPEITSAPVPADHVPFAAGQEIRVWNPKGDNPGWRTYTPDYVWPYRTPSGLVGYIIRIDLDGGKKIIIPLRPAKWGDETRWTAHGFDQPRPLYNGDRIPSGPVWIVEGEKAADALTEILGYPALTWPGGTNGVAHADFSPLHGRDVIVWPDADASGIKAATAVKNALLDIGAKSVRLLPWNKSRPKGWDAADALSDGWSADDVSVYLEEAELFSTEPAPIAVAPDDPDLIGSKITEDLVARLFVKRYAGQFSYDHSRGTWYRFDGFVWRLCETPVAFQAIRDLSRWVSEQTQTESTLQKVRFAKGAEEFARGDPVMSRVSANWNPDPFLLGTPGGTVDLRTGLIRPSDATDNINRATAIAPASSADCPIWKQFLDIATGGDLGLIRFLQQMCGYALTGDTREQALFFIHGPGGNGKGVFLNTLTKIMADYSATATADVLTSTQTGGATTDIAMLNGARLVSASENEEGKPWADARIKRMTGGDPITARFLRQDNVTFIPVFKLVVAGNYQPTLRTVDDAIRRRFNLIPFTVTPERKDDTLEAKLRQEWPAILRWMIDGSLDWQRNGLIRPDIVANATRDYFDDQDSTGLWLETKCRVERENVHLTETATALFQSWSAFSKSVGEHPGTQKTFSEMLGKMGFRKRRTKHGVEYHGIEIQRGDSENDY